MLFIVIVRSFTNTHQETLEKMKVSYLQDLAITQHSEALWQGERESLGFCFYEVKAFVGSLFIGEFKTLRVRTQSMGREKTGGPNGQEWKSARSPTQRSLMGGARRRFVRPGAGTCLSGAPSLRRSPQQSDSRQSWAVRQQSTRGNRQGLPGRGPPAPNCRAQALSPHGDSPSTVSFEGSALRELKPLAGGGQRL